MSKLRRATNPFTVILLVVGTAFVLTASAYAVMALRDIRGVGAAAGQPGAELLDFLKRHGMALLGAEVAILAVATVAAIWLDSARLRKNAQHAPDRQDENVASR